MIAEYSLNIFTDGSSFSSPRRGGIGILYVWIDSQGNEETDQLPQSGFVDATNNKMELTACIHALKNSIPYLKKGSLRQILIHSDSRYVVDNYQNAKYYWPKQKWHTKSGKPVANAHLWKDLIKAAIKTGKNVQINWVKGHSKNKYNKIVDKLAKQSAEIPINKALSIVTARRKLSKKSTELGSVEMKGQRITIRIITSEYLPVQKTNKYRYEVMSKISPYYGNIDFLYSTELLKAGHIYSVRFNCDDKCPGIRKLFKEVIKNTNK